MLQVADSGNFLGTFTLDVATGNPGGSYSFSDGAKTYVFSGTDLIGLGDASPDGDFQYLDFQNSAGDLLELAYHYISQSSAYICSTSTPCTYMSLAFYSTVTPNQGDAINLSGGTLDVTISTAPEPSSLMLLSSGILGVAGVVRRKQHAI